MNTAAIETKELCIGYRLKGGRTQIVHDHLNLHLVSGEVTCLLGLNGAGKSTLLRTLCGFQPALSGEIRLLGRPLAHYSQTEFARTVGVVLTEKTHAGGLTVFELASLGRYPYTGFFGKLTQADRQIVRDALEAVGIAHKSANYVAELSDGERQKVMIAKVLSQQCPLILLDEPTAFLDVTSRLETMLLLHRLAAEQHKTVLLSTHDLDLAIQLADNLSEEKSNSLSASVDFYHRFHNGIQMNLLVEGFYTNLSDVFTLEDIGRDEQGNLIKERRNGSGARVMGVTLEGKTVLTSWLSLQAGFTLQRSQYKEPEKWSEDASVPAEKRMFRTPDAYGYFTSTLTPIKRLTIALSGTYTGSMLVQHLAGYIEKDVAVETPDFFDMNIKFSYDVPVYNEVTLTFNAGVQNLFNAYQTDFDKGANRDSGYIYGPGSPRSYFAGMKISF